MCREDHVFIDAFRGIVAGRSAMRRAWKGVYLEWFPDYTIVVEGLSLSSNTVAMLGRKRFRDVRR